MRTILSASVSGDALLQAVGVRLGTVRSGYRREE